MYIDLRQKVVASIVGAAFAIGVVLLSPWWFALLALCTMVPFFAKLLTA